MELRSTGTVNPVPGPADPAPTGTTSFALRFIGYLYAVGLRDAFADLIARHEPLRTVYPTPEADTAHLVLSVATAPVPRLVPVPASRAETSRAVAEFVVHDFEPAESAPVRAQLFRIVGRPDDDPEHLLVVVMQRRAADRVTPARLAHDLMTAYAARRRNLPPRWETTRPADHLHVHELRRVELIEPADAGPAGRSTTGA
ncbi:hypothetical protein [Nocardia transvalensis]|uniref:hypothetical protein n=1 Tax=Nocardia transvalensis TaxID=37333 RepID=UPI001895D943|nr:hypothetical protein [Nocardia transvalensis]MBF6331531.1 hypothetical protein [Nocardia transvalensis]